MKYVLRLYVTGRSLASQHAIVNLRALAQEDLGGNCEIEIVNILDHPEIAEQEKIMATPTLVKRHPPPVRKIIGDLSQRSRVLFGLGLDPAELMESGPAEIGRGREGKDIVG
jgi:circadian clock protein KaiB